MFEDIDKVLLITDMDGTFLNSKKIPSEENLKAVERFQKAGGKFTIATGRALQAVKLYFEYFNCNFPMVMFNGGMVYDFERDVSLYDSFVPDFTRDIVLDILNKFPKLGCEILVRSNIKIVQYNDMEEYHTRICKSNPDIVSLDKVHEPWYKVLFADTEGNIDEVQRYVEEKNFGGVDFVRSDKFFYEILPTGNSKGTAVSKLREICNLSDYTIVCVGDYDNDIEMIEYADVGVCPCNAVESVKRAADIVLKESNDENAIAAVIDFIFSKIKNGGKFDGR